jgi:hypothetical protein
MLHCWLISVGALTHRPPQSIQRYGIKREPRLHGRRASLPALASRYWKYCEVASCDRGCWSGTGQCVCVQTKYYLPNQNAVFESKFAAEPNKYLAMMALGRGYTRRMLRLSMDAIT